MKELRVDIVLPASPEQVWKVLTDFDGYSSWNPYVSMKGRAALGERVKMTSASAPGKAAKATYTLISKLTPNAELELRNGIPLLTTTVRFFSLSTIENQTLLRHGVRLSGPLARIWFSNTTKARQLRKYYDAFGKALTHRLLGRSLRNSSGNRHQRRTREARGST